MDLIEIGSLIAEHRRRLGITQSELGARSRISRSTIAALEGGRCAELGFNKVNRILAALKLELAVTTANRGRPTFDQLKDAGE